MKVSVVSNSTPIIALASLKKFDLFSQLFDKIYVTDHVYNEIITDSSDKVGADELKKSIKNGNITLYHVRDRKLLEIMYGRLHHGELSVIVAAKEMGINFVLIDDLSARKAAESFLLTSIGTAGILKLAKLRGLIYELKPLLDELVMNNFRISLKLYNEILNDVNEL